MAFQVSPGVQVKEIDLTNVVPAVSTSIGATVGSFPWGPVEEIVTVGSEKNLVDIFGSPNSDTYKFFGPAAQFLQYGNSLKVVRALTGHSNATSSGVDILVKNRDHYNSLVVSSGGITQVGSGSDVWIAKYPGNLGRAITVSTVAASATAFNNWDYKSVFSATPGTSEYAQSVISDRNVGDEMHIVVIDRTGEWSGVAGTILETFAFVSQARDARKEDGSNNYFADVINQQSQYIWYGAPDLTSFSDSGRTLNGFDEAAFASPNAAVTYNLNGGIGQPFGLDDNNPTVGDMSLALDLFRDSDTVDINLMFTGMPFTGADAVSHTNNLIAVAEARKDIIAFCSPPIDSTVGSTSPNADVLSWANQLTSSSYAVIDSTALYIYDKYSDVYRYVNASGAVAGLCANTDNVADAWFSPAGLNRGQLLGITKVAHNPIKAERDELYNARVNPIVSFPCEGTVLFGDKTALAKPSAFDRINVRRLFIVLEKAISTASRFQLFEFNDEFTRAQFRNLVEPFLRDVKGRRGITDFLVVCDETNNTGQIIDSNQFVADIYIKPARSINYITLNFIATRTGVEFSEIVGQ